MCTLIIVYNTFQILMSVVLKCMSVVSMLSATTLMVVTAAPASLDLMEMDLIAVS